MDPFHFDTDPDLVPVITDPDPGRILTKIQSFEISQLFLKEKFCGFPYLIRTTKSLLPYYPTKYY